MTATDFETLTINLTLTESDCEESCGTSGIQPNAQKPHTTRQNNSDICMARRAISFSFLAIRLQFDLCATSVTAVSRGVALLQLLQLLQCCCTAQIMQYWLHNNWRKGAIAIPLQGVDSLTSCDPKKKIKKNRNRQTNAAINFKYPSMRLCSKRVRERERERDLVKYLQQLPPLWIEIGIEIGTRNRTVTVTLHTAFLLHCCTVAL